MEGILKNLPDLEDPWPIFFLTKGIKLPELQSLMPQNPPLGSCFIWILCFKCLTHLLIYLDFCGYMFCYFKPLWFTSKSKRMPIDVLKFLVSIKDKNDAFICVEKYGALARSYEFMKTCHNMKIIFQTTCDKR